MNVWENQRECADMSFANDTEFGDFRHSEKMKINMHIPFRLTLHRKHHTA